MTEEGSFPRLVQLIRDGTDDELGLHRVLVELMYEMSRIQEVAYDELGMNWHAIFQNALQTINIVQPRLTTNSFYTSFRLSKDFPIMIMTHTITTLYASWYDESLFLQENGSDIV